ncbi:MAG: 30S ribosomal protein S17 [Halobacteriales archaeon]|nr:30S ribosomal protein S17 [Halobacteriales archaeon]
MPTRDIGISVQPPQRECADLKCPFHGDLRVRGQILIGRVLTAKMQNTVVVQREFLRYLPKFERYERRRGKYAAHSPPCIGAQPGDDVTIMECRPLSKTKHFVVIEARKGSLEFKGEDYTEAQREAAAKAKAKATKEAAAQ